MWRKISNNLGIACLAVAILLVYFLFINIFNSFQPIVEKLGSEFPNDRELFIPVDKGEVLGRDAFVVADRNTGIMYIYTNGALSPLYNEDGELRIYER